MTSTTVGLDVHTDIKFHDTVKVQVWDFAGQSEYSVVHHHFLSSQSSVFLIVVALNRDIDLQIIKYWKSYIQYSIKNLLDALKQGQIGIIVVGIN